MRVWWHCNYLLEMKFGRNQNDNHPGLYVRMIAPTTPQTATRENMSSICIYNKTYGFWLVEMEYDVIFTTKARFLLVESHHFNWFSMFPFCPYAWPGLWLNHPVSLLHTAHSTGCRGFGCVLLTLPGHCFTEWETDKQGQTVHKLQIATFSELYLYKYIHILLARLCIYEEGVCICIVHGGGTQRATGATRRPRAKEYINKKGK